MAVLTPARCKAMVSALALLWPLLAGAQPARPAPAHEAPYVALDAAVAAEARALSARDLALADSHAKEKAAFAAADADIRAREAQLARIEGLKQELLSLLDQLEANQAPRQSWLVEKAVLQDWYQAFERSAPNLTERHFRSVDAELRPLAAAGMIEPGERRFRTYGDLRARIVELNRRIAADRAGREAANARLRQQLEALGERRDRAVRNLARVDPAVATTARQWFDATAELKRREDELAAARMALERATRDVMDAAGRLRPPVLSDLVASVDGRPIYRASWSRGDGTAADERDREARLEVLHPLRTAVAGHIDRLSLEQRKRSELRSEAAESMHRLSGYVQQSADRYAASRMHQFYATLAIDIGFTAAEVFLTGGTATLARKSIELAEQAAAKAAQSSALRRATIGAVSPLEEAVLERFSRKGAPVVDNLRRAAESGRAALTAEASAMTEKLVRDGLARAAAEKEAKAIFEPLIARLDLIERSQRLANEIQAGALAEGEDGLRALFVDFTRDTAGEVVYDSWEGAANLHAHFNRDPGAALAERSSTATATGVGEAVELGLSTAVNAYRDTPAQAGAGVLGRARAASSQFVENGVANGYKVGVGLVLGIVKTASAAHLDKRVNLRAQQFSELVAELNFAYHVYHQQWQAEWDPLESTCRHASLSIL